MKRRSLILAIILLGLPAALIMYISVAGLPAFMGPWVGRSLGVGDIESIERVDLVFTSPWAEGRPALVIFACAAMGVLGIWFYLRHQRGVEGASRLLLGVVRSVLLALLVTVLAEPAISLSINERPKPLLVMLFDGTDSMSLKDNLSGDEAAKLTSAATPRSDSNNVQPVDVTDEKRVELIKQVIRADRDKTFAKLAEKVRIRAYLMNRIDQVRELQTTPPADAKPKEADADADSGEATTQTVAHQDGGAADQTLITQWRFVGGVLLGVAGLAMVFVGIGRRSMGVGGVGLVLLIGGGAALTFFFDREDVDDNGVFVSDSAQRIDPRHLASQLTSDGQVTALGTALDDLGRRHRGHMLAGVVVFSDFDQNAGTAPGPAAQRLGAPVYAFGVGPREVVDLAVDLQAPLVVKKDESTSVKVKLRQSGLTGQTARVQLLARRLGSAGGIGQTESRAIPVAPPRTVNLDVAQPEVDITFTPDQTGRFMLQVKVDELPGEVLGENNTASREVMVRDESLHLFFVEYEPTWEWRFIKEVFHRDPLIGREGFRTFLRSADFNVRKTNELFIETMVRPRSEFFAHDVIFLSDIPSDMLSEHFQDMLVEYVERFGGGLVVIAGPRFGVGQLAGTKVGDMLPVVIESGLRPRIGSFRMQLTPKAASNPFMLLGKDDNESAAAWTNMGKLQWYQPVARPHPLADVLAVHPLDRCIDNQTPQPIIAVRRYGKGEVIYVGFNETWRLRRRYGEKYYRQFWAQMIYRLGLGRALGSQKRFLPAVDRRNYQSGDKVRITVEAYNHDFEALEEKSLEARLIGEEPGGGTTTVTDLTIPVSRDGVVFETSMPVFAAGSYRLLVKDPITGDEEEINFTVAPVSAERRNAVRDIDTQKKLANQSGGRAYELYDLPKLVTDLQVPEVEQHSQRNRPLWNTWIMLWVIVALMLVEWFVRKLLNMR